MTRETEMRRYSEMYRDLSYKMGAARLVAAHEMLSAIPLSDRNALLDVGCGRGELLNEARQMGFLPVLGTEVVPELCDGKHVVERSIFELDFKGIGVVTCFDVIEHILPEDEEEALRSLWSVAEDRLILSTNSRSTMPRRGIELHVNLKTAGQWYDSILKNCGPVTRLLGPCAGGSTFWEVRR